MQIKFACDFLKIELLYGIVWVRFPINSPCLPMILFVEYFRYMSTRFIVKDKP